MMQPWRVAESLLTLRNQINALSPNRSKASDGTIGDAAHASRLSDHNPWVTDGGTGVVTAIDITHDPAHGIDSEKLAQALIASRDPRIKYVISNKRICAGTDGPSPWVWRAYTGTNPHSKHVHLSVKSAKAHFDSKTPWKFDLSVSAAQASTPVAVSRPLLKKGSKGDAVKELQTLLNAKGAAPKLIVDGDFGAKTDAAVRAFQKAQKLVVDGKVGTYTWDALTK